MFTRISLRKRGELDWCGTLCWSPVPAYIDVLRCCVLTVRRSLQIAQLCTMSGHSHSEKGSFFGLSVGKVSYLMHASRLASYFLFQPRPFPTSARRTQVILPFELIQGILWEMTSHDVWALRRVCKAWQQYIETVISRDWLMNTWVIFEDGRYESTNAKPIFRICDPRTCTRPPSAWPLVRKDGHWLVYALPLKPRLPEHVPRPRHPNGRFMYAARIEEAEKTARSQNPEWANIVLDGKIHVVPPRCAVPRTGDFKLYASRSKKVRDGRIVGYDVGITDTSAFLKIDWRVLLSVMFTPTHARGADNRVWRSHRQHSH
ncbi:hypothetical protein CALCODRAFT_290488 [Calocera cornea HHB12733]|uniref:F-box domain-containing protein n=1 Tax=Calocera cornea HHB12733 TaxID=1353952 RepID=A0A165FSR7_9BASI|nr:hypothetical protein CALCODRAFT_290488 [Calocera cornea HHB12733]